MRKSKPDGGYKLENIVRNFGSLGFTENLNLHQRIRDKRTTPVERKVTRKSSNTKKSSTKKTRSPRVKKATAVKATKKLKDMGMTKEQMLKLLDSL